MPLSATSIPRPVRYSCCPGSQQDTALTHARLAPSIGTALKVPGCFEGILDGASVAGAEVRDNHHVLGVPIRDAERSGKLPKQHIAVVEVRADHGMSLV